jgi:hypothetical protein
MNYDFLMSLPWRLGSFAGLVVGCIAIACGVTDYVIILIRMGLAFFAFYLIGMVSSLALKSVAGVYSIRQPSKKRKSVPLKSDSETDPEEGDQLASSAAQSG